jgi:dihydroxyacetone kinase-like protein
MITTSLRRSTPTWTAYPAGEDHDHYEEVRQLQILQATKAIDAGVGVRSMGVALTSCTVPAVGRPTFELPETDIDIEIGIGIHGEPGRQRLPLVPAERVAEYLLERAGVRIARSLIGSYITSLEMAGCSVTLLRADYDLLELWDAPVHTPALRWGL